MTPQLTSDLSDEMVEALQSLIQINLDSRDAYRMAAGAVDDLNLSSVFDFFSSKREEQAIELSRFIVRSGEQPRCDGTFMAAFQRAWSEIRRLLSTNDRLAILDEALRGEDSIMAAYREALQRCFGTPVHSLLLQHSRHVQAGHERIRDLRDEYQSNC